MHHPRCGHARALAWAALAWAAAWPAAAQTPLLNFDDGPAGQAVNHRYRSLGVLLGCLPGPSGQCQDVAQLARPGSHGGPASSGTQVLATAAQGGGTYWPAIDERVGFLKLRFLSPVRQVSIQAKRYQAGSAASKNKPYLQAFGANNQWLATVHYPDGASGWQPLMLSRPTADIQYVLLSSSIGRGGAAAFGLFDDLAYAPVPLPQWWQLAAGGALSVGLRTDGSLWAWGAGDLGQLGNGGTAATGSGAPQQVGGLDWQAVATSGAHVLALKLDGTLWAWGHNHAGQVGDGGQDNRLRPVQVGTASDWAQVAAGTDHSLAVRLGQLAGDPATVWAWGGNQQGQLGDGGRSGHGTPQPVADLQAVRQVAAGEAFSLALADEQQPAAGAVAYPAYGWGANNVGQLGIGSTAPPPRITRLKQGGFAQVVTGGAHAAALELRVRALWTWGANSRGQLGHGGTANALLPTQVPGTWHAVAAGWQHTLAVRSDGSLWAWGWNADGQLGDGSTTDRHLPTQVGSGTDWVAVAAGASHSLAQKADGSLWAWGRNHQGQLGDRSSSGQTTPRPAGHWVVRAEAQSHGRLSPTGPQNVAHQAVLQFQVVADAGYTARVSGCGGTLSRAGYQTAPVTGDCTVLASFDGARANLVVQRFTAPAKAAPGQAITLVYRVGNVGALAAPASSVCLGVARLATRAQKLGCVVVPALAAGASRSGRFQATLPARLALGSHRLTATADATGQVDESDEGDNTASATLVLAR